MPQTLPFTNRKYLDAVEKRVLVFDGAMGTSLQNMNLTAEHFGGEQFNGCNDCLVISHPQAIRDVHRSFLEVGVDVLETDTFRSNRITLAEYDLADRTLEINQAAAVLARELADAYSTAEKPRFVAGSMGPTGKLPSAEDPDLSDVSYDDLASVFTEQAVGLIRGGVDLLLLETSQDILEVKAAIRGIQQAFQQTGEVLPVQAQVTLDTSGRMLLGTDIETSLTILEDLPIDVMGLNCSTGPEHMRQPIAFLGENASLPVSCIPNAGLPLNVDGEAVYPLEPEPFAEQLFEFASKNNINVVGGCCGTTPAHLKALVNKLEGFQPQPRPEKETARLSSSFKALDMAQEPRPLLIGERLNATGSRKFKRLLLAGDDTGMMRIANEQMERGAHALDVSVAATENPDELGMMIALVKKLALGVEAPLVIDTTDPLVMEAALKIAPGRSLLNSTHLEAGRPKLEQVFGLAKEHNAAVMVLTIDETGMAKTAERKLAIAERIHQIAVEELGFRPEDLVFDLLTFPLSTGDPEFANSAVATIEGIKAVKKALPGVFTSLGVSNVSFGLSKAARPVLNSLFLHHCVQAGLDMAIVDAGRIKPYNEISAQELTLMEDLIFNRRQDALQKVIEFYENIVVEDEEAADPTEGMTAQERLHWRILFRRKEQVEADIDEIILAFEPAEQHQQAVHLLNSTLLPAMKEVGDLFGAGDLILPFVLQSAEVMKKAVSHLEQYLDRLDGVSKGKVVLATVYGDVHDIGKNLVKTILENNGFEVVDLGKQVPAETIIQTALDEKATAIGLSALLVSTSKQMPLIINELSRRGASIPVMVGGAAINRRFGLRILYPEDGEQPYSAGVFYCKDAFEGLETMEALVDKEKQPQLLENLVEQAKKAKKRQKAPAVKPAADHKSAVSAVEHVPSVELFGVRVVRDMPLESVFQHLAKRELFRLSWGAKNKQGAEWEKLEAEFEQRLDAKKRDAVKDGWLQPQAVYGYFPCQSEGDRLLIYDPDAYQNGKIELAETFDFPRQPDGDYLCLADYFASAASGKMDVCAFQVVTVGQQATDKFDLLQEVGDYGEAYFVHGLAVQTAEAAAEYLHRHIRREMGLQENQGKRYSWGYPAIPELDDHEKIFRLLPAEAELGMTLTSAWQLVPEQSTAAVVLHHPKARYYTVGKGRLDQLLA